MSCITLSGTKYARAATKEASPTLSYIWLTEWGSGVGLDRVAAVVRLLNATGNLQAQFAAQYATVRIDKPNSPVVYDQMTTGERSAGGCNHPRH